MKEMIQQNLALETFASSASECVAPMALNTIIHYFFYQTSAPTALIDKIHII
jgi:hypothetical protein